MSRRNFLLVLILWAGFGHQAQGQANIFAYGKSVGAKYLPKEVGGYKYEVAKTVYDQLIQTQANLSQQAPDFIMNDGTGLIAWMDPYKLEIGIEEKAYDVCASFGPDSLNALATLLAHEIIHHYEKHDWVRQFAQQNDTLQTSDSLRLGTDQLAQETQADHLGGLLAFTAGYDTGEMSALFLQRAYEAYGYNEKLAGYPPLSERIAMAQNTNEQLRRLQGVWQTANLLSVIEEYELAKTFYQFILRDYKSYEVFNNAGVNAAHAAMQLFEPGEWPYAMPFEMDGKSRLDKLKIRLPEEKSRKRKRLLAEAARYFQSASQISKGYVPALINQACILTLQADWEEAEDLAMKAQRKSKQQKNAKMQADAQITLGVIAAMQERKEEAADWFAAAAAGNPTLAEINLTAVKAIAKKSSLPDFKVLGEEKIEELSLEDYLYDLTVDDQIDLGGGQFLGVKRMPHSELFFQVAETEDGREYILFHRTSSTYQGTSFRGVALGTTLDNITKRYGEPSNHIQMAGGSVLHYVAQRLFFELDEQERLTHWVSYVKGTN